MKKAKICTVIFVLVAFGLSNYQASGILAYDGGGSPSCPCIEICCGWDYVSQDCMDCFPDGRIHHCERTGETQADGCQAKCCNNSACNAEPNGCTGETPIE